MITGASVSAGYRAQSPGERLSLRYTSKSKIVTVAQNGTAGRDLEPRLTSEILADRTAIIALDFFFWDSASLSPEANLSAVDKLLEKASQAKVPIVLGDVPDMLSGRQLSRASLNRRIHEKCEANSFCRLLKLDDLNRKVRGDGFLEIKGQRYAVKELIPDGLHLSDHAAEYLADRIGDALRGERELTQ